MAVPPSWNTERVNTTLVDVMDAVQYLQEQLQLEKSTILQQKEIIQSQNKRIADLDSLVKQLRRRTSTAADDDPSSVLTHLQDYIGKMRENHERRKRKSNRAIQEEDEEEKDTTSGVTAAAEKKTA